VWFSPVGSPCSPRGGLEPISSPASCQPASRLSLTPRAWEKAILIVRLPSARSIRGSNHPKSLAPGLRGWRIRMIGDQGPQRSVGWTRLPLDSSRGLPPGRRMASNEVRALGCLLARSMVPVLREDSSPKPETFFPGLLSPRLAETPASGRRETQSSSRPGATAETVLQETGRRGPRQVPKTRKKPALRAVTFGSVWDGSGGCSRWPVVCKSPKERPLRADPLMSMGFAGDSRGTPFQASRFEVDQAEAKVRQRPVGYGCGRRENPVTKAVPRQ
jgi:hypothetical protein